MATLKVRTPLSARTLLLELFPNVDVATLTYGSQYGAAGVLRKASPRGVESNPGRNTASPTP